MTAKPESPRILVADDQSDVRDALRLLLKSAGFTAVQASSPAGVEATVANDEIDLALLDMNYARDTTSGKEGLDLISRVRALDPDLPIVVMTAWGTVAGAVEAIKRGASDYVEKPWDNQRLIAQLELQLKLRTSVKQAQRLTAQAVREHERGLPALISSSPAMSQVRQLMSRVAGSDASVLITGEHGTGKDVVARWIHASSPRASRAFVPVNASALAEGVFESELFGHVRGAFTDAKQDRVGCFELADGGTLFLDEIGSMPQAQQAKLLRVLQSGEFQPVGSSRTRHAEVRVLAATNADISQEVRRGAFREDLLYRLNTVEIHLPPLRDRREDVVALAEHFLSTKAERYQKRISGFSPEALGLLLAHSWPGNVRELEHVVERAVVLAEGAAIEARDLNLQRFAGGSAEVERMTLADAEAYMIRKALARTAGNVVTAAEQLGLSRSALYRRLQALGIRVQE
jgi:DNA-binding NtrC family response regulator